MVGSYKSIKNDGLTMLVFHIPYILDHPTDYEHYDFLEELTIRDMLDEILTLEYDKNKQDHPLFKDVKMILFIQFNSDFKMKVAISMNSETAKYMFNTTFVDDEYNIDNLCNTLLTSFQLFHMILPTFLHYLDDKTNKPLFYCDLDEDILYSYYSRSKGSSLILTYVSQMIKIKDDKDKISKFMDTNVKERLIVIVD